MLNLFGTTIIVFLYKKIILAHITIIIRAEQMIK